MEQKLMWMIMVILKGIMIVVGLSIMSCGADTVIGTNSVVLKTYEYDTYSNGDLKIVSVLMYVLVAALSPLIFFLTIFSLVAQLALKKLYESKKKLFLILHIVLAAVTALCFLLLPLGLILACDTIDKETGLPASPYRQEVAKGGGRGLYRSGKPVGRQYGWSGPGVGDYGRTDVCKIVWKMTTVIIYDLAAALYIFLSVGVIYFTPKVKPVEVGALVQQMDGPPPQYESQNAAPAQGNEPISASPSAPANDVEV